MSFVDGIYATSRWATCRLWRRKARIPCGTRPSTTRAADNETVARFLMAAGLSWMVRGHIESNTANGDFGAFVGLARGMAGSGVLHLYGIGES